MRLVEIVRRPGTGDRESVATFVDRVASLAGARPLSDHLWLDLHSRDGSPLLVSATDPTGMIGLAQISAANDNAALEVVIRPDLEPIDATRLHDDLVETAVDAFRAAGGGTLSWWVDDPTTNDDDLAARCGLEPVRTLHEMRRSLPLDRHADVVTRPFVVGRDEEGWLAVNNRAFAGHGEQGGWTRATLDARMTEPWFDPDGFRLHERDGHLAAFCWTKLHHELDPVVGEIYVIAVNPEYHGLGLGKQLTLAGLDSIADRKVTVANLYVDADNSAAVGLYRGLGFDVHRTRRVFAGTQPDTRPTTPDRPTETP